MDGYRCVATRTAQLRVQLALRVSGELRETWEVWRSPATAANDAEFVRTTWLWGQLAAYLNCGGTLPGLQAQLRGVCLEKSALGGPLAPPAPLLPPEGMELIATGGIAIGDDVFHRHLFSDQAGGWLEWVEDVSVGNGIFREDYGYTAGS